jgi:tetratricopeptide (TPR) repeat protein
MGKQKKKPVSSKKIDTNSPKKIALDLNDVISKADASLEASDLESALQLYKYAAKQLRSQLTTELNMKEEIEDHVDPQQKIHILTLSKVLSKLGETKVSLSQQDSAKLDFLEARQVLSRISVDGIEGTLELECTEVKAGILLYLAQLSQGEDALEYFQLGIQSLITYSTLLKENSLESHGTDEIMMHPHTKEEEHTENMQSVMLDVRYVYYCILIMLYQSILFFTWAFSFRRQVSKAYCSIAELYLTDLCYESDAEVKCEEAIQSALMYDDPQSSPDALQALANLRLSQTDKRSEAYTFMLEAYQRMKTGCEALAQLVGLGKEEDTTHGDEHAMELQEDKLEAVHALPPFEFRCQSVKILLECASILRQSQQNASNLDTCVEASIQILGSLLAENDEVPEIFYLLGAAFISGSNPNIDSARFYLDRALEMAEHIKQEMEKEAVKGMHDEEWEDGHDDIIARIEDIRGKISELERLEEQVIAVAGGN